VSIRETGADNGKMATARGDTAPAADERKPLKGTKRVAGSDAVTGIRPG